MPLPVASFREKPDLKTAKKFFKAGNYFWNAGMFFWKAETVLDAMRKHQPKTATLISSLPAFAHADFAAKLAEVFPLCENISVDFGVIEHADNVAGCACDEFGWSDVGSWDAVYELTAARRERQRRAFGTAVAPIRRELHRLRAEAGSAAGRQGSDHRGHAGCPAGGGPVARATGGRDRQAARETGPRRTALIGRGPGRQN